MFKGCCKTSENTIILPNQAIWENNCKNQIKDHLFYSQTSSFISSIVGFTLLYVMHTPENYQKQPDALKNIRSLVVN